MDPPWRLAQDIATTWIEVLDPLRSQRNQSAIGIVLRVKYTGKAIADANDLPTQFMRRQCRAHDHGAHAWNKTAAHINGNFRGSAEPYFLCS